MGKNSRKKTTKNHEIKEGVAMGEYQFVSFEYKVYEKEYGNKKRQTF
jgi:hypothetical protein